MGRRRERGGRREMPAISALLAGRERELVAPILSSLAGSGAVKVLGDDDSSASRLTPDLVLASPAYWPTLRAPRERANTAQQPQAPVLLCLSAENLEEEDLYEAAGDFVVVPCAAAELAKRIYRLAFRGHPHVLLAAHVIRVGDIALNTETYQVSVDNKTVSLAWTEFQLLKFLMEHPGRIFKRADLLNRVWGVEYLGGARTVDVHVRRLRHKLGPRGERYLRTVRNVGYGLETA